MINNNYYQQVELLLEVLPLLNQHPYFALKGGTAINLFVQDMPRLSIDIDLCYLPIEPRDVTLNAIAQALIRLGEVIKKECQAEVTPLYIDTGKQLAKLLVTKSNVEIKIEPNLVIRGSVFSSERQTLCKAAQDRFLQSIKINMLSIADVYAGKICAALARQHPRDFFDIKMLFDNGGITTEIRKAFVIYLASSPRPMNELLNPNLIDIRAVYESEFAGIALVPVSYDELIEVRQKLIDEINQHLTMEEKQFLLSIKQGEPQWDLLNIAGIENLPAIEWKVMNVKKMERSKHQILIQKLAKALQL